MDHNVPEPNDVIVVCGVNQSINFIKKILPQIGHFHQQQQ